MIRSPIKWAGGKLRLRKQLIAMLPPHKCYVEVFGGAGWVLLGKEQSRVEIFNDIDGDVVNFFEVVQSKPEELIRSFDFELVSRRKFDRLKNQSSSDLSDVERAHQFYYLIMAAWGGESGSPRFQTSISDGGNGNRLIGAMKTLRKRIEPVHTRIQTVIFENLTWQECLKRYDRQYENKKVVMYLDPPYPNNRINYKHNMRGVEHHEELADALSGLGARFLLSSYDLPEVREIYKKEGFFVEAVDFAGGMPTKENKTNRNREIIVSNYEPNRSSQPHD